MKNKKLRSLVSIILGVALGFYLSGGFQGEGRYGEARKVVSQVTEEVRGFYEQTNKIPENLSFIQDPELEVLIAEYNISFNPSIREIESRGNWTYRPDFLYRLTFGLFGDEKAGSVGEPGFTFENEIPAEVEIAKLNAP